MDVVVGCDEWVVVVGVVLGVGVGCDVCVVGVVVGCWLVFVVGGGGGLVVGLVVVVGVVCGVVVVVVGGSWMLLVVFGCVWGGFLSGAVVWLLALGRVLVSFMLDYDVILSPVLT
ncbi:hypothetical protein RA281_27605, partial [Pseudomonas syringae pv. tagetis]